MTHEQSIPVEVLLRLFQRRPPGWTGIYSFALVDAAGVAAANRFLSLFNAGASGVVLIPLLVIVGCYATGLTTTLNSIRLLRITAASAGALQAATAIHRFSNSYPEAVGEVRTANPTVTGDDVLAAFPPPIVMTAAGALTPAFLSFFFPGGWGEYTLDANEGVALDQAVAGTATQAYDMTMVWAERRPVITGEP